MKKFYLILLFFFNFSLQSLHASVENSIVVKIDNQIITNFEIKNKIISTLILSNQEINQANINSLKKQTLETLIQLKLKIIELSNYDFIATDNEINQYLNSISSNDIKSLENKFIDYGLDYNLFLKEVATEFKWKKFIIAKYSKKINIDENQIDFELDNLIENDKNLEEYDLSEIETKVLKESELKEIIDHINDYNFEKAAQKYSVSTSSINGGSIGWVSSESLSGNILKLLKDLKVGEYTKPLKRNDSFFIFYLNDKRKISNFDKDNLEKLKKSIIDKKTNDLLTIYSNNHLSIKRNKTLIDYQ